MPTLAELQKMTARFAPAEIGADISALPKNEREALARDLGFGQRRIVHPAQLRNQSRARTLIKRATALAGVLLETGDRLGDERIIIGHTSVTLFPPPAGLGLERVLHQYGVFPLRTGR